MEALTIQPQNEDQLNAIKAVLKALKIPFEKAQEKSYNPDFVNMVNDSEEEYKAGKATQMDVNDLWK